MYFLATNNSAMKSRKEKINEPFETQYYDLIENQYPLIVEAIIKLLDGKISSFIDDLIRINRTIRDAAKIRKKKSINNDVEESNLYGDIDIGINPNLILLLELMKVLLPQKLYAYAVNS